VDIEEKPIFPQLCPSKPRSSCHAKNCLRSGLQVPIARGTPLPDGQIFAMQMAWLWRLSTFYTKFSNSFRFKNHKIMIRNILLF
jgi:hypothetical protein